MLANFVARRTSNIFLKRISVKAFSTQVKSRTVPPVNEFSNSYTTINRESFERSWPKLAEKQEHHISMVREKGLPVHRSGLWDDQINTILYIASGFGFIYCMYLLGDHIIKT